MSTHVRFRPTYVAVAVLALVVAASFALPPVRALAGQFLGIFRIQSFQTVTVTQADMDQMTRAMQAGSGHVALDQLGDVWVEGGEPQARKTSLEAAQTAVDFPIRLPQGVAGTQTVVLQPAMTIKFRFHVDKVNALLDSYGADKTFSKDVDGKVFEVRMPATVVIGYGERGDTVQTNPDMEFSDPGASLLDSTGGTIVVQTRGPELVVPSGVDALQLRDVLLNLPLLPETVRKQLASVQDWQHTLLVPNVEGSTKDITLAGMPAVFLSPKTDPDMPQPVEVPAAIMWQQDGVVVAVAGVGGESKLLKIAESVAR